MPVIGTFSAVKDGYTGTIRTLSPNIKSSPTIAGRPMAPPNFASWRAPPRSAPPGGGPAGRKLPMKSNQIFEARHTSRAACGPKTRALNSRLQFEENSRPGLVPGGAIVLVAGARLSRDRHMLSAPI
jgi:hypothetical protein